MYKRQITELHSKLENENKRADRLDFESKKLLEKLEALTVERDRLQAERDTLKETNDEMTDQIKLGGGSVDRGGLGAPGGGAGGGGDAGDDDNYGLEMIPPAIKERLLRLQHENKRLKQQVPTSGVQGTVQ